MRRSIALGLPVLLILVCTSAVIAGGRPASGAQVRLGLFLPEGDGAFWAETEQTFTTSASELDGVAIGATFVTALNNYVEAGVNWDYYAGTDVSQYRECFVDPCETLFHEATLRTMPVSADIRVLPFGRYRMRGAGRQVLRPAFYIGGGVGVNLWSYEEEGEFYDFTDPGLPIFYERYRDDGVALNLHALVGVEFPVRPYVNVVVEGRYNWADDDLGRDFVGLGEIDLGGPAIYAGAAFRF